MALRPILVGPCEQCRERFIKRDSILEFLLDEIADHYRQPDLRAVLM
ncbi:MAG TPA: hypothetical protein VH307_13960 [Streptosporangiaceae bacterium]|jgi:hypothetical protein|nr:hypothetical protein [Streptosporangiaceae bacterium]